MEFELRAEDGTVTVANSSIISLEEVQLDTPTQSNSLTAGGLAIGVDLIVNGDFENNPVNLDANGNGFGFFDAIEGWTATLGQLEIQEGANSNSGFGTPGNGILELASNQNAGVQQTVTVAEGADGIFTLSLEHARRNDDNANGVFQIIVDGELVSTVTSSVPGAVQDFSIDLALDAGDHTIEFLEIGGGGNGRGTLIDNVSLISSGEPLPEPEPTDAQTISFAGESGGRFVNLETSESATPLRVLPLGDSITLGIVSAPRDNNDTTLGGYRDDLFNALLGDDILIDFVGSRTAGPSTLLDQDHEGTSGIRADMLGMNLPSQIAEFDPDIVLLMAGTNDSRQDPVNSGQTTPQDLLGIILTVLDQNPEAQIFVSTLIPQEPDGGRNSAAIPALAVANEGIVQLVADLNASGFDNVHLVDNSDLPLSLISDLGPNNINDVGVHPTDEGFAEIASRFLDALNNVFDDIPGGLSGPTTAIDAAVQNIIGANGNDLLIGNGGTNEIDGRAGNDVLDGGAGDDILTGGTGRDIFVVSEGSDTVTDFQTGTDFIDLDGTGISSFSELLGAASDTSAGTTISSGNASITLQGIALAQLNGDSFIFDDGPASFTASASVVLETDAAMSLLNPDTDDVFEFAPAQSTDLQAPDAFGNGFGVETSSALTAGNSATSRDGPILIDDLISNDEIQLTNVDDFFF